MNIKDLHYGATVTLANGLSLTVSQVSQIKGIPRFSVTAWKVHNQHAFSTWLVNEDLTAVPINDNEDASIYNIVDVKPRLSDSETQYYIADINT